MRLLVTGREGQVVRSLVERAAARAGVTVIPVGRPELDLSRPEAVAAALDGHEADIIVSAAAYTAVDKAEDEPELALAVNAGGAGAVAHWAQGRGIPVIHLSTDYVFSGDGGKPYGEDDAPGPRSVYGRSKLAGERAVAAANPRHVILRTAWVYSPFGGNFVKTMLRLGESRDRLSVVADQHGNPTSALDIADGILKIAATLRAPNADALHGIYHFAGAGEATWYDLARHVFAVSSAIGGPFAEVAAITADQYPTRAVRPGNSRLDCTRFARTFGAAAPDWHASVEAVVRRLVTPV
jgi:dTDP-4-dehydrorhamnose reductase